MGDYAKQWDRPYPRGVVDQLSGKNPYTPHYGEKIATGIELPNTTGQPNLAGRVDPYGSCYGGSGSTDVRYDDLMRDAQIKAQRGPSDISLSGHPAAEQAMRFECLKIAAGMNPADNTALLAFAESLLKWVRGN